MAALMSDIWFLEPPHCHDPSHIAHVCTLPSTTLSQLPDSLQDALWAMQESVSIAFASYSRLQALLSERFSRLFPQSQSPPSWPTTGVECELHREGQHSDSRLFSLVARLPSFCRSTKLLPPCPLATGHTQEFGSWASKCHIAWHSKPPHHHIRVFDFFLETLPIPPAFCPTHGNIHPRRSNVFG